MLKFIVVIATSMMWLLCSNVEAISIKSEQVPVLDLFFRKMVAESEAGFVFYGQKPICFHGFRIRDNGCINYDAHKHSVYIYEAAKIWRKLDLKQDQDIIIHFYDHPDSLVNDLIPVLFINKPLFLQTVRNNIALFQYVLGNEITPEKLLKEISNPENSFHTVLKEDKVLVGILLGFGTQNSLYGSRFEKLQEALMYPSVQLPNVNKAESEKDKTILEIKNSSFLQFYEKYLPSKKLLNSQQFNSNPIEELASLIAKMKISSEKLSENMPYFIFGRLKEDVETDLLIKRLEDTQDKIIQLLAVENFLDSVLKLIYPNEIIIIEPSSKNELTFNSNELEKLPSVIATNVWEDITNEHDIYLEAYINGIKDSQAGINKLTESDSCLHYKMKVFDKIKSNLKTTNDYFLELAQNPDIICVSPGYIYYNQIKKGEGDSLTNQTSVTVNYSFKTYDDIVLNDTWELEEPAFIDLNHTITGFAWGVRGMKKGEIREIWMHPSVVHGIYTNLEKGTLLKANVELVEINENNSKESSTFPPIDILGFDKHLDILTKYNFNEIANKSGYEDGYEVWEHYKQQNLFSLDQILAEIKMLKNSETEKIVDLELQSNQDIINRLHWNIYAGELQKDSK